MNNPAEDRPEVDEIIERFVRIRSDWDWRETIDPVQFSTSPPLSELDQQGIYNRAVVIPAERSPYTMGLESELKALGDAAEELVEQTSLGRWLSGEVTEEVPPRDQPLIEVVPMNTEQCAAVTAALSARLTVVTGPPGTGKSQVVTNLLVNAAWQGMKVLFASKNNKAVNVVEARVNGLGNRPVLLRLGSREYQARLVECLTAMLSGTVSDDDKVSYEEVLNDTSCLPRTLPSWSSGATRPWIRGISSIAWKARSIRFDRCSRWNASLEPRGAQRRAQGN